MTHAADRPRDHETTASLAESAGSGDEHALNALIERYLPHVRAFVRFTMGTRLRSREESMDIVQSSLREMVGADLRELGQDESRFRHRLFQTAKRKAAEKGRFHGMEKRDAGRAVAVDDAEQDAALWSECLSTATPSAHAIGRELESQLADAVHRLPEEDRQLFFLRRIEGLAYDQIADLTGATAGSLRVRYQRLLARLAGQLKEE